MSQELKPKVDWQPSATIKTLKQRAELLQQIRQFFLVRHVLEVETPLLSQCTVTDTHIASFVVPIDIKTVDLPANSSNVIHPMTHYYLQTSPEYAMKRLLAAGSCCIFQISKAFRVGEQGRFHNPEFSLLEWYRVGYDHHQMMDEIEQFLDAIAGINGVKRLSYQQLFQKYCAIDILNCQLFDLHQYLNQQAIKIDHLDQLCYDDCLNLILTHIIEPLLINEGAVFIYDFPRSQAALAKICSHNPLVASRFELYIAGIEIANGFYELTDHNEQEKRFNHDCEQRARFGLPVFDVDHRLLAALNHGLPDCAGVALGLDRLMMVLTDAKQMSEVISFSWDRA
jgi:lysyl-tRNA synthetase class 2